MIDFAGLLGELGVHYDTSGKNTSPGRFSVRCPMPYCNDHSNHGSFGNYNGYPNYRCWKCKGGRVDEALALVSNRPKAEIWKLMDRYTFTGGVPVPNSAKYADQLELPGYELEQRHLAYLYGRGLDPHRTTSLYGLKCTPPNFQWKPDCWFSDTIIIPVRDMNGAVVSFQGRFLEERKDGMRYKACPLKYARANYKDMLYGADLAAHKESVVVVEGVVDAWKLGPGAVATFGTGFTAAQVKALSYWKSVVVAYDNEPEAQAHARDLAYRLNALGVSVGIYTHDWGVNGKGEARDIGDLAPHEVTMLKTELGI